MRHLFNEETWEFIAKIFCDMGKAVLGIGLASYFFQGKPLLLQIFLGILGLGMLVYSVYMISKKGVK